MIARTASALLLLPLTVSGQNVALPASVPASSAFEGPAPPEAPAVFSRDAAGRVTMRAMRLAQPLKIDGVLDEPVYTTVPPVTDFLQTEPQEGASATERTEVWVTFDSSHVYVSFRCWESDPLRMVANEMRRDSSVIWQGNDLVGFLFDTFYDRRNGVLFTANAIGGRQDGQVTNERQWNGDWNPVWEVKTGRFDQGWTVEAALPFKSLRYRPGREQIWGFNALRTNRWKNEISLLTPGPAGRGQLGLQHASMAATLVGLEVPAGSRNLDIKPYGISSLTGTRNPGASLVNKGQGDGGVDVKYGISQNWTADFTYRTDFAQVEADEQQVNLTRFSLFFPEKREFFLENQGLFSFGGANTSGVSDTPILFYSRRIGLDQGRVVPIEAGGRLTGRARRFSFGLLSLRTDEDAALGTPPATFSVARLKRDILRRSNVGVIFTGRTALQGAAGGNRAFGADAVFGFYENLNISTYWAGTHTEGLSGDASSYRAQLDYGGDRYGVQLERLSVGTNFRPEVGFVRRPDMRRNYAEFRFSPRPLAIPSVRKFFWTGSGLYTENGAGRVETREWKGEFGIEFQNNDRLSASYTSTGEFLPRPFDIAAGVTLPVRNYEYGLGRLGFNLGPQRRFSAQFGLEHGTFYSGRKTALSIGRGRLNLSPQLAVEPSYSINRVRLAEGSFTTHLVGSRITYAMTPVMFTSALVQYNSATNTASTNIRFRWEYHPGSEFFVVYNEERDTLGRSFPDLANRALIVKINRLVRF